MPTPPRSSSGRSRSAASRCTWAPGRPAIEHGEAADLHFESADGTAGQVDADLVLVATGRGPNVAGIGLEAAGVEFDPRKGVDRPTGACAPSVPHIFAVGDVAGRWQLAHTSFREGEVAAENATGHEAEIDYAAVPRCIYTDPEVGARRPDRGRRRASSTATTSRSGRFPFSASTPARRCTARRRDG